ncbi:hypothetical protein JXZ92_02080 [Mycoplasma sp. CSL10137]|uniref:MSC_0882 family membrane protein n=1 Tax=unclassified Mycoplasma TaxID=2683645 RepID=UPI00197BFF05|nr:MULTISPECIES: hypothetical protein [unclassified Mycoplasma]MBN4083608.1 hypothetical protein [Mycoplasma sp. CSL10137]MBN4084110.1 hypothetical protein [Mycoplasma sp. CSL10166]MBU4693192.1 hypothetical protein [Mycoplasma sp. CSL7491-lung]MCU4706552.1 hypothetical protein [Mycoplasma sp. CSL7503-lung]
MFKPKQNNTNSVNIETGQIPVNLQTSQINNSSLFVDPQKQLNPSTYSIIKKEKRIRYLSFTLWGVLFLLSLAAIGVNYFLNTAKDPHRGIGWYVLIAFVLLISFSVSVRSLIKISGWKNVEKNYRSNYSNGDAASSTMFADLYKALTLKSLRLTWIFVFFTTYFLIFNLAIITLYFGIEEVTIGQPFNESETNGSLNLHIYLNLVKNLDSTFGNTTTLLAIDGGVFVGIFALYLFITLYDKKRIQDVKAQFGTAESAIAVMKLVEERKASENKAWFRTYIIIFILVVLLPLVLIIYLSYRGIIRRGKK